MLLTPAPMEVDVKFPEFLLLEIHEICRFAQENHVLDSTPWGGWGKLKKLFLKILAKMEDLSLLSVNES